MVGRASSPANRAGAGRAQGRDAELCACKTSASVEMQCHEILAPRSIQRRIEVRRLDARPRPRRLCERPSAATAIGPRRRPGNVADDSARAAEISRACRGQPRRRKFGEPGAGRSTRVEGSGAMSETAEAGTGGRRGRGGGGAARRAERTAVRVEAAPFIRRRIPNYEILDEEGLALIEANAETVLEEIGVRFADNPAALKLWKDAGADVRGDRVHLPKGLARKLCATAPREYVQRARNPERDVTIGGQEPRAGAGLRAAVRAGRGERAALCDDRGLPQLREARLLVEVAAPFGRHGLRADRRRGEQAASRHAAGAHDALRQAVHGVGDGAGAGGRFGRDVPDPVRGRERRAELLHDEPDQHQLAAGVRRDDDGGARGLCPRRAGDDRLAVHRRRRDGAGAASRGR